MKNKNIKWWISAVSYTILFVGIGVFTYFKTDFLIHGVEISAKIDHNNTSSIVEIAGKAENAVHLSLNGREIFIDKDGSFKEPAVLLPGLSVITLNAKDKFGKTSEKKFEVLYKESTGVAIANEIINTN